MYYQTNKTILPGLIAVAQKKTDRMPYELVSSQKKKDQQMAKTDHRLSETCRIVKDLSRQIGGLANKFGGFTEGMALPSMQDIVLNKFKMEEFSLRIKRKKKNKSMEIDAMAYANSNSVRSFFLHTRIFF